MPALPHERAHGQGGAHRALLRAWRGLSHTLRARHLPLTFAERRRFRGSARTDAHLAASFLAGALSLRARELPTSRARNRLRAASGTPGVPKRGGHLRQALPPGRVIVRATAGGSSERQVDGDDGSNGGSGGGATTMPYASCHLQCSAAWLGTRVT